MLETIRSIEPMTLKELFKLAPWVPILSWIEGAIVAYFMFTGFPDGWPFFAFPFMMAQVFIVLYTIGRRQQAQRGARGENPVVYR